MPYYGNNSVLKQPIEVSSTQPTTTREGSIYYDTVSDSMYIYINGKWVIAVVAVDGAFDFMNGFDFQYMDNTSAGFMTG